MAHEPEHDAARRTPGRRRRAIAVGAVVTVLVAAGIVAVSVGSSDSPSKPQPTDPPPIAGVHVQARVDGAVQLVADHGPTARTGSSADVASAEQSLALRLFDNADTTSNVSYSPLSLYVALGMLRNGAVGDTETQIATAMQSSTLSAAATNAGIAGLMTRLGQGAAQDGITLQSANSLWQQTGFPTRAPFLADLASYYKAGLWQTDFGTPAGAEAINRWVSKQTHGKIPTLFDHLSAATALVLANAIFFKAAWAIPFDPNKTDSGRFTTAADAQVPAKFMSGHAGLQTKTTPDYDAVQLPYRGGRFTATAVMPLHTPLKNFVKAMSGRSLAFLTQGMSTGSASVSLPKFSTTSATELNSTLQFLGMKRAFTDGADLSKLSSTPTKVDQVVQRVYLGVGEQGTTAAAATGVTLQPTGAAAPGPEVRFDHPFLFLVRDTMTGAVLFASEINDPSAR